MEAGTKEKLIASVNAVGDLYTTDQIDLDVYGRFMVQAAYEFMHGDEIQLAVTVVNEVPDKYYEEVLPVQMINEPQTNAWASYVARRLKVHGVVDGAPPVNIVPRIGVA